MDQDDFWADASIQVAAAPPPQAHGQSRSDTCTGSNSSGRAQQQQQKPKRFQCTQPGCNKRFTRMEHMQRHALNHTAGESTCPRCNAHFKRPDLLGTYGRFHLLDSRLFTNVDPVLSVPQRGTCIVTSSVTTKRADQVVADLTRASEAGKDPTAVSSTNALVWHLPRLRGRIPGLEKHHHPLRWYHRPCQTRAGLATSTRWVWTTGTNGETLLPSIHCPLKAISLLLAPPRHHTCLGLRSTTATDRLHVPLKMNASNIIPSSNPTRPARSTCPTPLHLTTTGCST